MSVIFPAGCIGHFLYKRQEKSVDVKVTPVVLRERAAFSAGAGEQNLSVLRGKKISDFSKPLKMFKSSGFDYQQPFKVQICKGAS